MKHSLLFLSFFALPLRLWAVNEVGPEGYKLLWILAIIVISFFAFFIAKKLRGKKNSNNQFKNLNKISISTNKQSSNILKIDIKNKGLTDVQIKQPLLIFKNKLSKRKFNLKGGENVIYPVKILRDNEHSVVVDLEKFYQYDNKLTSFKNIDIVILDIYNNTLASKKIQ